MSERKPGCSRLVYDKTKRTIVVVTPNDTLADKVLAHKPSSNCPNLRHNPLCPGTSHCPICGPICSILDRASDKVLTHKPKPKSKPARKRARRAKKLQAADV